jgi:hypothetical protein
MHQVLNDNNKPLPVSTQKLALVSSSSYKKLKKSQEQSTSKRFEATKLKQQAMTRLSFPDMNGLMNEPLITKSFFKEKSESLKSTELKSKPSSSSSSQVSFQNCKRKNSRHKQAQYNSDEEEIPFIPQQQHHQQPGAYQQKFMKASGIFTVNAKVIHSPNKNQSLYKNKNEKSIEKFDDSNVQNCQTFHLPSLSIKASNKRTLDSLSNHNQTRRVNELTSKNTKHFTTSIDGKKLIDDDKVNTKSKNQDAIDSTSLHEKSSFDLKEKPLNPVDFYIKMNLVNNPNLFAAIQQTSALPQNSQNLISTLTELNSNKHLPLNANSIKKLKKVLNLDELTSLVNYRANKYKENMPFNPAEIKPSGKPKKVLNPLTSSITNQQNSNENSNSFNLPPVLRIEKSDLFLKWARKKQTQEKSIPFDASIFHNEESVNKSYQANDELTNEDGQVPIKILIKKRDENYSQNDHEVAPWSTPRRTDSFSFSDKLGGSFHELTNLNSKSIDTGKSHYQMESHPEVCLLCQREYEIRKNESIDLLTLDVKNFNRLIPSDQVNQKMTKIFSPPLSPHQMYHKSISDSDIKMIKKAVCFPPPANLKTKRFI